MSREHLLREVALHGGVALRRQLPFPARVIAAACADGDLVRSSRGQYALPAADHGLVLAHRLHGARSHRTAALAHGWSVTSPPSRPEIIVPRGHRVAVRDQRRAVVRWRPLSTTEKVTRLTSPLRTVVDCLCDEPEDVGLSVTDSALRAGAVTADEVDVALARARRHGVRPARELAQHADGRAANAFESQLRLLGLAVPHLSLTPQQAIGSPDVGGFRVRVDLADVGLGIVAEADSFEWHGGRRRLAEDAFRYDELAVRGWLVLRFAYEQVFGAAEWVVQVLQRAVATQRMLVAAGVAPWRDSVLAEEPADTWDVPA